MSMRHARRGTGHQPIVVLAVVLVTLAVVAAGLWRSGLFAGPSTVDAVDTPARSVAPSGAASSSSETPGVQPGPVRFDYAASQGALSGSAGQLRRYRVAVEAGTGQDVAEFAAAVQTILGDPRGWTAGGRLRFQRVPKAMPADFTVYLATAATSESMCAAAGLHTHRYASCRLPGEIVLNLDRWLGGVAAYGAAPDVYRAYALNHEVGHELGYGHEACPAAGAPAPVMQQQTYDLQGCTANGWPYLDGQRYSGPSVP